MTIETNKPYTRVNRKWQNSLTVRFNCNKINIFRKLPKTTYKSKKKEITYSSDGSRGILPPLMRRDKWPNSTLAGPFIYCRPDYELVIDAGGQINRSACRDKEIPVCRCTSKIRRRLYKDPDKLFGCRLQRQILFQMFTWLVKLNRFFRNLRSLNCLKTLFFQSKTIIAVKVYSILAFYRDFSYTSIACYSDETYNNLVKYNKAVLIF